MLCVGCRNPDAATVPPALELPELREALSADQYYGNSCASELDPACLGPRKLVRTSLEQLQRRGALRFSHGYGYLGSTGSRQVLRSIVAEAHRKPRSPSRGLQLAAAMGEAGACERLAGQSVSSDYLVETLQDLCPRDARRRVEPLLAEWMTRVRRDIADTRKAFLQHRAGSPSYHTITLPEFIAAAGELQAREALDLLRELSALGFGLQLDAAPENGELPPGSIALDVARMQVGDTEHADRIRRYLTANVTLIADVEPIAAGLGYFAEDAPLLIALADRFHSAGPAEAVARYLDRAARGGRADAMWRSGSDAIVNSLDGLARRGGGDPRRDAWLEAARLRAGRPGAAERLLALGAGAASRSGTWTALILLARSHGRLTTVEREATYERAIELFEDSLVASSKDVLAERVALLEAVAPLGGAADGRWAVALFDEHVEVAWAAQLLFGRFLPRDCSVLRRAVARIPAQPYHSVEGASANGIDARVFPAAFAYAVHPRGTCSEVASTIARDGSLPGELRVLGIALLALRGEPFAEPFTSVFGTQPSIRNQAVRELLNIARHTEAIPIHALPPPLLMDPRVR